MKYRKNDFVLDEWPPERSRDGKDYINLEKLTILNFEICEKGKILLVLTSHRSKKFIKLTYISIQSFSKEIFQNFCGFQYIDNTLIVIIVKKTFTTNESYGYNISNVI